MQQLPTSSGQSRLGALDSLRGLAAFAVLLGHTLGTCEWRCDFVRLPLVYLLFDGVSAVTMFFVLSGFVLTFSHFNQPGKPFILVPFYVRRFTRIWLPWFAFFLFSLLAKKWLRTPWPEGHLREGPWLASMWQGETTLSDVLRQMVFQLHNAPRMLLSQDWSLGVELRAALLIPVFLLLARWKWWALAAAGIGLAYYAHASGYYYTPFAAGVLAAYWNSRTDHCRRGGILFAIGLVFYQARWLYNVGSLFPSFVKERDIWVLSTVGCTLILLGTLRCGMIRNFLEHRFFLFLGRVSYSLYLLQMIVLICLVPWIVAGLNRIGIQSIALNQFMMLIMVSSICLLLADLGVRVIEVPSIQLGKVLTIWLARHAWLKKLSIYGRTTKHQSGSDIPTRASSSKDHHPAPTSFD